MKTSTALGVVLCLCLLTACSPRDREVARDRGENAREKVKGAAEKLKQEAEHVGSKLKAEAQKVGATPEAGPEHSPEEKLRRGAEALRQESEGAGAKLSQAAQTAKVKYNLTAALGLAGASHINVDSNGNTVTLEGSVASADQKAEAQRVALATEGVTKVINSLRVEP